MAFCSICLQGRQKRLVNLAAQSFSKPFSIPFYTCVIRLFWATLQEEALLTLAWLQGSQGPQRVLMLQVVLASAGR